MSWDDAQYLKFADERTRPARELLARVPLKDAANVVDLGCGPGNSTALLVERYPSARVIGVDADEVMLRRARRDLPSVTFIAGDFTQFSPASPPELIFANAALHWADRHDTLFPRLFAALAPGGVLAVQMPHTRDEPSHVLMRELPGPWRSALARVKERVALAPQSAYYDWLAPRASYVDLWETRYEHVLADAEAIVAWVEGTGLRPYLAALDEPHRAQFRAAYRDAIDRAYPAHAGGRRLFTFPRRFLVAQRLR